MTNEWNREKLLELGGSFLVCRILITAAELDLFSKLTLGPRSAEDICATHDWDLRGLTILMDALASQGLLLKSGEGEYSLPEPLRDLLARDGKGTILPMLLHRGQMWRSWSHLTGIVKSGENPNLIQIGARSQEDMEKFIGAMHVIGSKMAEAIADGIDLGGFKRMLDVGGASGTYTMAFLDRAPQMTATVFDLPQVMDMARKRLTEGGFIDRVDLVAGDYKTDSLPKGHDLALLSAVIHSNGREDNRRLYGKVHEALDPGGMILIRDHFLDDSRTYPPDGAVFAVNMLVATRNGTSYALREVREDLENAGFRKISLIRDGTGMDQLVSAYK